MCCTGTLLKVSLQIILATVKVITCENKELSATVCMLVLLFWGLFWMLWCCGVLVCGPGVAVLFCTLFRARCCSGLTNTIKIQSISFKSKHANWNLCWHNYFHRTLNLTVPQPASGIEIEFRRAKKDCWIGIFAVYFNVSALHFKLGNALYEVWFLHRPSGHALESMIWNVNIVTTSMSMKRPVLGISILSINLHGVSVSH